MAVTGIVFDLQRGSLRDGPGVRTTVFLKGCPLRCMWCHNPEAMRRSPQLFFAAGHCVTCGACASVCPRGVHAVVSASHTVNFKECTACAACVAVCSHGGLRISGEERTVDDLMPEIESDRDFYDATGGGVTLSGGEPLCQAGFAESLLRRCRQVAITTCVETSGFVASEQFLALLPLIDLLLFDYKLTTPEKHKAYTGVSNELILQNLDLALAHGAPIILRCPIIPGINDNDEHFRGICRIDEQYPRLQGIELLAYHHLGVEKAKSLGMRQRTWCDSAVPEAERQSWIKRLRQLGCTRAILG